MKADITRELETCNSVVVIKPCCGAVVYIAVNHPFVLDAAAQQEIGELVARGCRVEHWTWEETKMKDWQMGCQCQSEPTAGEFSLKFIKPTA